MNIKKVLAGALASVMAVSTMAVCASATDVAVDSSKIIWGDIEGNGNLRVELFNIYGTTSVKEKYDAAVSPVNPADIKGGNLISVTLTIAGLPDNMETHQAKMLYAGEGWYPGNIDDKDYIDITGNGTYTFEFCGNDAEINGAVVFTIDFLKLASTLEIPAKDNAAAMEKVTISDVKISVTNKDGNNSATSTDGATSNDPAGETSKDPATSQTPNAGDKNQPNTGVEGVAVVAGLAVLATGAIVIAKKRK